jgi:hypothetical protein
MSKTSKRDVVTFQKTGANADHLLLAPSSLRHNQVTGLNISCNNLTLALHKSRFVEFTVKPEKASDANSP